MQPTIKRLKTNTDPLILDLDVMNADSFKINAGNSKKIIEFLENNKENIPFSGNEDIADKLIDLAEKIQPFSERGGLAAKIESLASTILMPNEIIDLIFSYLDVPSQSNLAATAPIFRNWMMSSHKISFNILPPQALHEALETVKQLTDIECRDRQIDLLSGIICRSDMKKAMEISKLVSDGYDNQYYEIALHLTSKDPIKAVPFILNHITNLESRDILYNICAINLAQTDADKAYDIALKIDDVEMRATTLQELLPFSGNAATETFWTALETANMVDDENRDWVLSDIIVSFASIDHELALASVEQIGIALFQETALIGIAGSVAKTNRELALEIIEPIEGLNNLVQGLASIAASLSEIDSEHTSAILERALSAAYRNERQFEIDQALNIIAEKLAPSDPEKSLEIANLIVNEATKNYCLESIVDAMAPCNPKNALKIAEQIKGRSYTIFALRHISRAFLPDNPSKAFEIASRATTPEKRGLIYSEIAVSIAKDNHEQALEITKKITTIPQVQISTLIKIALVIKSKDPLKAREIIMNALENTRNMKGIIKSNCQIAIYEVLQEHLTE